jgi:hypothetical protein
MANVRARIILVGKMAAGTYIEQLEQLSFLCCLPGRQRAIERLGIGRRLLPFPHLASS